MDISESQQMYLKTIYLLSQTKGSVRHIDVANELNFSKPSVTIGLKKLVASGDIQIDDDNIIKLTKSGRSRARKICMRYDTFMDLFSLMGIPRDQAHETACKVEHDINDDVFEKMKEWVETHNK